MKYLLFLLVCSMLGCEKNTTQYTVVIWDRHGTEIHREVTNDVPAVYSNDECVVVSWGFSGRKIISAGGTASVLPVARQ